MSVVQAESVFAALRAIGDVMTPTQHRQEATHYIETCRQDRATVLVMKGMLESPQINNDSTWCFLCLKLFEDCLYLHWNSWEFAEQVEIRKFACTLIDLCSATLSSMPIRTKLAKLISELAKRQYPQLWDSLVGDLLGSWTAPAFSLKAQVGAWAVTAVVLQHSLSLCG